MCLMRANIVEKRMCMHTRLNDIISFRKQLDNSRDTRHKPISHCQILWHGRKEKFKDGNIEKGGRRAI